MKFRSGSYSKKYYSYFYRNPYNLRKNTEEQAFSKSERAYYKKYLILGRFFNVLSITTLRKIADTWVDPTLKKIKSKSEIIDVLLEKKSIIRNATKSVRDDGVILFTLKYLATKTEINKLLKILGISRKTNDTSRDKQFLNPYD